MDSKLNVYHSPEELGGEFNEYLKEHGSIKLLMGADYHESGTPQMTLEVEGRRKWLTLMMTAAMVEDESLYTLLRSAVASYETSVLSSDGMERKKATVREIIKSLSEKSRELVGEPSFRDIKFSAS